MCMCRNSQYLLLNVNQDPTENASPRWRMHEPIIGPRSTRLSGGPFRICRVMVPVVVGCRSQSAQYWNPIGEAGQKTYLPCYSDWLSSIQTPTQGGSNCILPVCKACSGEGNKGSEHCQNKQEPHSPGQVICLQHSKPKAQKPRSQERKGSLKNDRHAWGTPLSELDRRKKKEERPTNRAPCNCSRRRLWFEDVRTGGRKPKNTKKWDFQQSRTPGADMPNPSSSHHFHRDPSFPD